MSAESVAITILESVPPKPVPPKRIAITILEPLSAEHGLKIYPVPKLKPVTFEISTEEPDFAVRTPAIPSPVPVKKEPEDSSYPEGTRGWFYILFAPCFAKKYLNEYTNEYLHKVLWFDYTCDGKMCLGLHRTSENEFADDLVVCEPTCLVFFACIISFIQRYTCCICYNDDDNDD